MFFLFCVGNVVDFSRQEYYYIFYVEEGSVDCCFFFLPRGGGEKQHVAMSALIQSPGGKSRMLWSPLFFFFFLDATAHTESDYINAQYQFIVTGLFYYFLASSGCVIGGWRVYIEDMLRLPSHDAERDESCLVFI